MSLPQESFVPFSPTKPKPRISSGVPFPQAVAHHLIHTLHAHKPYLIVSQSISKTQNFVNLKKALNDAEHGLELAGMRFGISSHTPWDQVLEVVSYARECGADALVTLGAGSLTDGGKVAALVSFYFWLVVLSFFGGGGGMYIEKSRVPRTANTNLIPGSRKQRLNV
jgi:hypothetical protein